MKISQIGECFLVALRLGLTSFGGPVAHIGFMREEYVVRRAWITEEQFVEKMALCHFLPGPASSQLGAAIGYHRGGVGGGFAAWFGFTLPSAIVMILAALGVVALADSEPGINTHGLLKGLKFAAIAVVAHALLGMKKTLTPDWPRSFLALGAFALLWFIPGPFATLAVILLGATAGLCFLSSPLNSADFASRTGSKEVRFLGLFWLLLFTVLLALSYLPTDSERTALGVLAGIYQSGALVFGGGHVVLPLLESQIVALGWMNLETFLGGYGLAQAVPGPLFTFAAYLGAGSGILGNPWLGGFAALTALFLPGMLLLAGASSLWSGIRDHPKAQCAVQGANAVVVGVLAVALVRMITRDGSISSPSNLVTVAILFVALWSKRVPVWLLVILSGVWGAFLL